MTARTYTAAEVDQALAQLGDPARFAHAQEVVTHLAPGLQSVLAQALHDGGWFDEAHRTALREAAAIADPARRASALDTLIAEETRMGMLVGVAVGLELSQALQSTATPPTQTSTTTPTGDQSR